MDFLQSEAEGKKLWVNWKDVIANDIPKNFKSTLIWNLASKFEDSIKCSNPDSSRNEISSTSELINILTDEDIGLETTLRSAFKYILHYYDNYSGLSSSDKKLVSLWLKRALLVANYVENQWIIDEWLAVKNTTQETQSIEETFKYKKPISDYEEFTKRAHENRLAGIFLSTDEPLSAGSFSESFDNIIYHLAEHLEKFEASNPLEKETNKERSSINIIHYILHTFFTSEPFMGHSFPTKEQKILTELRLDYLATDYHSFSNWRAWLARP